MRLPPLMALQPRRTAVSKDCLKIPALAAAAFAAAAVLASPALAQLEDENLLVVPPNGYEVGYQAHNSKQLMTELVPEGETVENWTEMVTVQIFRDLSDADPAEFRTHMRRQWFGTCDGATIENAADDTENGYPAATWMLTCPLNTQSGKPEYTMFKAIGGNDALYVVQKAFTWEPSEAEVAHWSDFLGDVTVCDSRLADRACPTADN